MQKFFIAFFVLLSPITLYAQTDSLQIEWAELSEEGTEITEILENLSSNPVSMNDADREEWLSIPFITPEMADSILSVKDRKGRFASKRDLSSIVGRKLYSKIKDFVILSRPSPHKTTFTQKNYRSVEEPEEIKNNVYTGDEYYSYTKMQYQYGNSLKAGFLANKDVGENSYLDLWRISVEYKKENWRVIAGSYYLQFGEGLLFSNPFSSQKSSMATMPFRTGYEGGSYYLSTLENSGQTGVYLSTNLAYESKLHVFYGRNQRDARLNQDGVIIGIDYDGYHRTEHEEDGKDLINENMRGVALTTNLIPSTHVGLIWSGVSWDPGLSFNIETAGESEARRQYYNFSGDGLNEQGIYYQTGFRQLSLSGEASFSDEGSPGYIQSIYLKNDKSKIGVKYWYLTRNFQSPYGRVFDDSDPFPRAEEGIYLGITIDPADKLTVNGYKLLKKSLWREYFEPMPVKSDEWLLQTDYKIERGVITARLRQKQSEEFTYDTDERQYRFTSDQTYLRLQFEYRPSGKLRLRTRWEFTRLQPGSEEGTNLFQDISFATSGNTTISGRISFFETESWDTRIYEYESDIPGSFANIPVYGKGHKWYIMIRKTMIENVSVWLKLRYRYMEDINVLSNGWQMTESTLSRDIRFQMQLKL